MAKVKAEKQPESNLKWQPVSQLHEEGKGSDSYEFIQHVHVVLNRGLSDQQALSNVLQLDSSHYPSGLTVQHMSNLIKHWLIKAIHSHPQDGAYVQPDPEPFLQRDPLCCIIHV